MGKVFASFLEEVNDFLKVNQEDIRFELYRTSTYTTAAGASTVTVLAADVEGFKATDKIRVGLSAEVTIVNIPGAVIGPGVITVDTAISFAKNDAVFLTFDGSIVPRATIYEEEEFQTVLTQPLAANVTNEVTFFAPAGRYCRRWFNNVGGATLQVDHAVVYDELDSIQVTPGFGGISAGIQAAIQKLSATAVGSVGFDGGKIILGDGVFTLTAPLNITDNNVIIEGQGSSTIIEGTFDDVVVVFNGIADATNGIHNVFLKNLTVRSTVPVGGNGLVRFVNAFSNWGVENVLIDGNALTHTGQAFRFDDCHSGVLNNLQVDGDFAVGFGLNQLLAGVRADFSFIGGKANGVGLGAQVAVGSVAVLPGVAFFGTDFVGSIGSTDGATVGPLAKNISFHNCLFEGFTTGARIDGAETTSFHNCRFRNLTTGVVTTVANGGKGIIVMGCGFDTMTTAIQMDGASKEWVFLSNTYTAVTNQLVDNSTEVSVNALRSDGDSDQLNLQFATVAITGDINPTGRIIPGTFLNVGNKLETALTIAAGAITVTKSYHTVDTVGGKVNLNTINGSIISGDMVWLRLENAANPVVVQANVGNLVMQGNGDFHMKSVNDSICFTRSQALNSWFEISRSGSPDGYDLRLISGKMFFPTTGMFAHVIDRNGANAGRIELDEDFTAQSDGAFLDLVEGEETDLAHITGGVNNQLIWLKTQVGQLNDLRLISLGGQGGETDSQIKLLTGLPKILGTLEQNAICLRYNSSEDRWYELFFMTR